MKKSLLMILISLSLISCGTNEKKVNKNVKVTPPPTVQTSELSAVEQSIEFLKVFAFKVNGNCQDGLSFQYLANESEIQLDWHSNGERAHAQMRLYIFPNGQFYTNGHYIAYISGDIP